MRTDPLPPKVSIVVISYNTRQMTLECMASIYDQTTLPFELIVVDNASDDGSAEAISVAFPPEKYTNFKLITEKINHGFGPAHRVALRHVTTDWLLLLNPDTLVLGGAIDALFSFAQKTPEAGIWGGRTLYGDHSLNPTSVFQRMTLWSVICRVVGLNVVFAHSAFFNSEYFGDWDRGDERAVDIVTGCLFLINRALWDELGGFDDDFVMYGEEVDMCLRAIALGASPRMTPDATIIHYGGASQNVRADKMVRLMKAKTELIKRHFSPATRGIGRLLLALWPLSRALAWLLISLTARKGAREKAKTWMDIWNRRSEWKKGYSN